VQTGAGLALRAARSEAAEWQARLSPSITKLFMKRQLTGPIRHATLQRTHDMEEHSFKRLMAGTQRMSYSNADATLCSQREKSLRTAGPTLIRDIMVEWFDLSYFDLILLLNRRYVTNNNQESRE
jgi:hypothetical protein